jgi:hypothetical protein
MLVKMPVPLNLQQPHPIPSLNIYGEFHITTGVVYMEKILQLSTAWNSYYILVVYDYYYGNYIDLTPFPCNINNAQPSIIIAYKKGSTQVL